MAWYLWLYIAIGVVWFFDSYSTLMRATPQNYAADLIVKPIFVALLSAVWPAWLVVLLVKQRKVKVPAND